MRLGFMVLCIGLAGLAGSASADETAARGLAEHAAAIRAPIDAAGGYDAIGQSLAPWRDALAKRLESAPPPKPGQQFVGADIPLDVGDGWIISGRRAKQLLYESDFEGSFPEIDARYAAAERALVRAHRELETQGIRLLVVLAPDKSDIYPEKLGPMPDGVPTVSLKSKQLYQRLLRAGVEVVDVEPALRAAKGAGPEPIYIRRDTHWSPAGARIAAGVVADRLAPWKQAESELVDRPGQKLERHGDLDINLRRAGRKSPGPEQGRFVGIRRRGGGTIKPDARSPVLVMGDSFTTFPYGHGLGFWVQLSGELGFAVRSIDQAGGGNTILKRFAQMPAKQREPVGVLVLLFTNCTIYEVELPEVPLLESPLPTEPMRGVSVTLLEDALRFDPKATTYTEAVVGVRASIDRGDGFPVVMQVYAPAMADRALLPAAGWAKGDTLTLDLLPTPPEDQAGVMVVEGDVDPALPVGYVPAEKSD